MPGSEADRKVRHRPSYQDILARDPVSAPALFQPSGIDLGVGPIAASRYTSPEFFKREIEKVWLKTWQFACRDEDISKTGDTYVFDLVGRSVIITRQEDGSLRAMRNVCLHRGRKLVTGGGCRRQFRCAYHGLTWNTDGSFKENPFAWDFPQVTPADMALPQVRVETWAGFIFVNFDNDAEPLLKQIAPMPEHFGRWRIEDCFKAAHVGKIVDTNWKAAAEAFLEAYHIIATHPQVNAVSGIDSVQTDILSDHVTRFLNPAATTPGTHPEELDDAKRIEIMQSYGGRAGVGGSRPIEAGETSRAFSATLARERLKRETGLDFDDICEAEVIDGMAYDFFPNFHLWGGFNAKICYRFRPAGLDHEKTLLEIMLLKIAPRDEEKPSPAPFRLLAAGEPWSAATELGYLAGVYDQDESNFAPLQEGLRAMGDGELNFAQTLDLRCRHLHHMIDAYMAR